MRNQRNLMSSERMDWGTPWPLFEQLNELFEFDVDVCAGHHNAKLDAYWDEQDDALSLDWCKVLEGRPHCWCNPPYGREIGKWVAKAQQEAQRGALVVCLLPARTETKWFQIVWEAECVLFLKGRLRFEGAPSCAPFPSCLAIFGRGLSRGEHRQLSKIGRVICP